MKRCIVRLDRPNANAIECRLFEDFSDIDLSSTKDGFTRIFYREGQVIDNVRYGNKPPCKCYIVPSSQIIDIEIEEIV